MAGSAPAHDATKPDAAVTTPSRDPLVVARDGARSNEPLNLELDPNQQTAQNDIAPDVASLRSGSNLVPSHGAYFVPLFKEAAPSNQATDSGRGGFVDRHAFGIQLLSRF